MYIRVDGNTCGVEAFGRSSCARPYRPVESPSRVALDPLLVAAASEAELTVAGGAV